MPDLSQIELKKAVRDKYDPHGGRAIGSRNMLDSEVAEYGGEMLYINKSAGKPMWAMEYSSPASQRASPSRWSSTRVSRLASLV